MAAPYSYQAEPQAVATAGGGAARTKYRPPVESKEQFTATGAFGRSNIMGDKRVRRGVTCPPKTRPLPSFGVSSKQFQQQPMPHPPQPQQSVAPQPPGPMGKLQEEEERPPTPPAVAGRSHFGQQTQTYIEHLTAKPKTKNVSTQTDPAKDYPVPPMFKHRVWLAKPDDPNAPAPQPMQPATGSDDPNSIQNGSGGVDGSGSGSGLRFEPRTDAVDVWTLIEQSEGLGLFDFDVQSEPIVHVLTEKTLEHALQEVCEEEESKQLSKHASAYAQQRMNELTAAQRAIAFEQRKQKEKERRIQQARDDAAAKKISDERETAKECAKLFLQTIQDNAIARLEREGRFYDPTIKQINDIFMPWTVRTVSDRLRVVSTARATVDSLLHDVLTAHTTAVQTKYSAVAAAAAANANANDPSYIAQLQAYAAAEDSARIPKPHIPYEIPNRMPPPASGGTLRSAKLPSPAKPDYHHPEATVVTNKEGLAFHI